MAGDEVALDNAATGAPAACEQGRQAEAAKQGGGAQRCCQQQPWVDIKHHAHERSQCRALAKGKGAQQRQPLGLRTSPRRGSQHEQSRVSE